MTSPDFTSRLRRALLAFAASVAAGATAGAALARRPLVVRCDPQPTSRRIH